MVFFTHANRVDTAAIAFSADALRQCLPLLRDAPDAALLARLLPASQVEPLRGAAIVDGVQAQRTAPAAAEEFAEPEWPQALAGDGPHREAGYSWGGLGQRGQYTFQPVRRDPRRVPRQPDRRLRLRGAGSAADRRDLPCSTSRAALEAAPQPLVARAPRPQLRPSPILDRRATA